MNFLLPVAIVVSLLLLELIFLLLRRKKDHKLNDTPEQKETDTGSICLEVEDCWCCKYNLPKQKKEEILKEFGDLHCGKSVESILNNEK